MYSISCRCGEAVRVRLASAGTTVECPVCGDELSVPSMRVLKEFASRGESVPVSKQAIDGRASSDCRTNDKQEHGKGEADSVPDSFFAPICGDLGPSGNLSVSAFENYAGLLLSKSSEFVSEFEGAEPIELMVSVALLPKTPPLIQVQSHPFAPESGQCGRLEGLIRAVAAPDVVDAPVGFFVLQRVNVDTGAPISLTPFGQIRKQIEKEGLANALLRAGNAPVESNSKRRLNQFLQWFSRLLPSSFANRSKTRDDERRNQQQQFSAWLDYVDRTDHGLSLKQMIERCAFRPNELESHVMLARHYAQLRQWNKSADCLGRAIVLQPSFAALYQRRASIYLMADNRQDALRDINTAIDITPFDPDLFYRRSSIFLDLDAIPQAIEDLSSAISVAPREPTYRLARAGLRLRQGLNHAAEQDLRGVLELDPNSGPAHSQLGMLLQQDDEADPQVALDLLSQAISLMPDDVLPRISRALIYAGQNKIELALQDCDEVIELEPESGAGHGTKGRVLQMHGEMDEAIRSCSRAIELGLESPMVLIARGFSYAATNQIELAMADCNEALALDPDNPLACHLLGMLSIERGELDTAMKALTKARDIAPEWPEPREQLALLHRINEDPEAAVDEQSILVNQNPANPAHYVNRAFAYTQTGEFNHALADYEQALRLDPENEQILFLRGCFYLDLQNHESALQDFDRVLELDEDHDDARLRRASVLMHLKRHSDALGDFEKLIERHPEDPQAYAGRTFAHQMVGDEKAAAEDLDQLLRIMPEKSDEVTIHSLHAKVNWHESNEQYDQAINSAEEIIKLDPENPLGYRLRGWICWYSEQHVEALDDYTRLLEMEDDDDEINVLNSRGQVLAEMGEWDRALEDLERAVDRSRNEGQAELLAYALNGRSLALAGLGRIDESTRDFHESVSLRPGNAWTYYNRGIVLHQQGDRSEAIGFFEKALDASEPPLNKRKRERAQALVDAGSEA